MIRALCQTAFTSFEHGAVVIDLFALDGSEDEAPIPPGTPLTFGFAEASDHGGFADMVTTLARWAEQSTMLLVEVIETPADKRVVFRSDDERLVLDVATMH